MFELKKGRRERVKLSDMGLYLRLIHMDYKPKNNEETAKLISENFNVECFAEDIDAYESLYICNEDYEKLSKMAEFNVEHLIE